MLDRKNLTNEQKIFFDGLTTSGFPADDAAFRDEMQGLADEANLPIANPSKYSAFWRFVNAAVAEPLRSIIRYLVTSAVPGFYVKTATGSHLDLLAWAHALSRKEAVKATGLITFSRAAGATGIVEIPAGTRVRTIAINGTIYRMISLESAVISADAASIDVLCEAEKAGSAYNLGSGYYSILDSDIAKIGDVTNSESYLQRVGADAETDEELRLRIRDRFLSVGDWHTDAKYRSMIAERAGIRPDRIYFDHEIPRGPGSADAYIIFDAGTVPDALLSDLNSYIATAGNHGHGDDLVCKTIPEKRFDLTVSVRAKNTISNEEKAQLLIDIEQMIRCAFWDNSDYDVTKAMPYSIFSFSKLAAELHSEFSALIGIEFSLGVVSASLELPKLGTLTVAEATA